MTRKIKAIAEELCGHEFSASAISEMNVKLDGELERFARRALEAKFPYLILDARYEKAREECVIRSRAVLVAIGIVWEGRRQILALEIANRESTTNWRELLLSLKQRGLGGVRRAISDDHAGLKRALAEVLPKACRQRCYVHFLRNALDPLPRKVGDDCRSGDLQSALRVKWMRYRATQCLTELRDAAEARVHLAAWIDRWAAKHPKFTTWIEEQIEKPERSGDSRRQTFTFYRLPYTHHKHLKSTNLLGSFHQESKRRSLVVRMLPAPSGAAIRAACGSSAPWPQSSTRNGSTVPAPSTCNLWQTSTNPASSLPPERPPRINNNLNPSSKHPSFLPPDLPIC